MVAEQSMLAPAALTAGAMHLYLHSITRQNVAKYQDNTAIEIGIGFLPFRQKTAHSCRRDLFDRRPVDFG
jgi:hypothetical protein